VESLRSAAGIEGYKSNHDASSFVADHSAIRRSWASPVGLRHWSPKSAIADAGFEFDPLARTTVVRVRKYHAHSIAPRPRVGAGFVGEMHVEGSRCGGRGLPRARGAVVS